MHKKFFRLQLTPKVAEHISYQKPSLQDILFALFQDSRCAKASQVVISTSTIEGKTWLAIADDGEAIFTSNVSGLADNKLASKDTYSLEFVREISICNLFNRGAIVESKKLSVTLAPENFPVNRDVQMRSSNIERGTKVSFPITSGEITELLRVVKCFAAYTPIPIIFNGSKFIQSNRVLAQV
jgi:hypothetical protein